MHFKSKRSDSYRREGFSVITWAAHMDLPRQLHLQHHRQPQQHLLHHYHHPSGPPSSSKQKETAARWHVETYRRMKKEESWIIARRRVYHRIEDLSPCPPIIAFATRSLPPPQGGWAYTLYLQLQFFDPVCNFTCQLSSTSQLSWLVRGPVHVLDKFVMCG